MDIKLLRNFIEVVESGSMTAASKKLFIAQPALSNQLKSLEKELGSRLLDRTSRRQELTEAGRLLYRQAKLMVSLENSVQQAVKDYESGAAGTLRIALTPSNGVTLIDGWLAQFAQSRPNLRYELFEADSYEVVKLVESGVVDLGLVRTPCHLSRALQTMFFNGEGMAAAYREDRFSFGLDEKVPVTQLEGKPICIIRRYEQMVQEACENNGFLPEITCRSNHLAVSLSWAIEGLAVAVAPSSALQCGGDRRLKYKLIDEPAFFTKRVLIARREGSLSEPAYSFWRFCQQKLQEKIPSPIGEGI